MDSNKLRYSDGTRVHVAAGEHGAQTYLLPDPTLRLDSVDPGDDLAHFRVSVHGTAASPVATRQHETSPEQNSLHRSVMVEFICFGHSHLYPIEEYPLVAPAWRDRLLAEARQLARSLQGDQAIAEEYLNADASLGAFMTHVIAGGIDLVKGRDVPKPAEYNPLMTLVWHISDKVKQATAANYEILHEAGLDFMHVRFEQQKLNKRIHNRLENLITAAEAGEKGSEATEDAAFWILDLYGQVVARDPARLFAYRFAVLMVRAGFRGVGCLVAEESKREAFHEAARIIRQDLPKASTALLMAWLKKAFPDPNKLSPMETFAEQLIGLKIFIFFEVMDFALFEADQIPADERNNALLERLAPKLASEIESAIAAIVVSGRVQSLGKSDLLRKKIESLGATIPATINSCISEIAHMRQIAKAEKRPFHDVFCAEGGWALIHVIRDTGKAFFAESLKESFAIRHEQDKKEWTALIFSLRMYLAPVDGSRLKAAQDRPAYVGAPSPAGQAEESSVPPKPKVGWKEPVPRLTSGGSDGGIARLRTAPGEPAEGFASPPPKPSRSQRQRVTLTPEEHRLPRDRETLLKMVGAVGPAYTWQEVELAEAVGDTERRSVKGKLRFAHVLGVILRDEKNQTVAKWWEVSRVNVKLKTEPKLGHTEQQALVRIALGAVEIGGKVIQFKVKPGFRLIFVGSFSPCPSKDGCSEEMKRIAREMNVDIDYLHVRESGTTPYEYTPEGRILLPEKEKMQKNHQFVHYTHA